MRMMTLRATLAVGMTLSGPIAAQTAVEPSKPEAFVAQAERELAAHALLANRVDWINRTYITEDTDALAAEFGARGTQLSVRLAKGAAKFDGVKGLPFEVRRKTESESAVADGIRATSAKAGARPREPCPEGAMS